MKKMLFLWLFFQGTIIFAGNIFSADQSEKMRKFDEYLVALFSECSRVPEGIEVGSSEHKEWLKSDALARYSFHHISGNKFISQKQRCIKTGKTKVTETIRFSSGSDRFFITFHHNNKDEARRIVRDIWDKMNTLSDLVIYDTDSDAKVDLRDVDVVHPVV